ncbi:MAG: hypothetical protein KBB39_04940 [Phycicoccus sp.]|nr:hypothetical protein [Phycicoccus sp.]
MDLSNLARQQHGVISRAQALPELGPEGVRWRLTSGRWLKLAPGIYQTHTGATPWLARASAALLHAGEGAALSLRAAAHLHGFLTKAPPVLTVDVPADRRVRRIPGVRITRRRGPLNVMTRRALAVTSVPVTVLALAAEPGTTAHEAIAWAADACRDTLCTPEQIADELQGRSRHPYRHALSLALGVITTGAQSVLEVRFAVDVVQGHGLPPLAMQVPAAGDAGPIRRDFANDEFDVVVEVDGRIGHDGAGVQRDRVRDRRALREGKVTVRAGWIDVDAAPCALALDLAGAFRLRGWTGAVSPCGPNCAARASSQLQVAT